MERERARVGVREFDSAVAMSVSDIALNASERKVRSGILVARRRGRDDS